MRRSVLALASACGLLAVAALSGCSNAAATSSSDGPIHVSFWHTMTGSDGPAVKQIIDNFNASQTDIKVDPNPMPADVMGQKLLTAMTTKDGPDLVNLGKSDIPSYAAKGMFASTDEFYSSDKYMDTSVLNPVAIDATKYQGHSYAVPFVMWTQMLYYNKSMFKAAGLDPENPPTTWDEWIDAAKKLTIDSNNDGKPEQYGLAMADHAAYMGGYYVPLIWNGGGDIVSPDGTKAMMSDPKTISAMKTWTEAVTKDHISPIGLAGGDADKLFQTGKAAMEAVGPWMSNAFTEAGLDFGVTRVPVGPEGKTTLADLGTLSISAKSDAATKDACMKFMAYWNSVESQIIWANGSGFPPNRQDIEAGKITNPIPAQFGPADVMSDIRMFLPGLVSASTISNDIVTPALQKVLNGEGSVEEVFGAANTELQADLDTKH